MAVYKKPTHNRCLSPTFRTYRAEMSCIGQLRRLRYTWQDIWDDGEITRFSWLSTEINGKLL